MENLEYWIGVYFVAGVVIGIIGCYETEKDRNERGLSTSLFAISMLYFTIMFLWFPLAISEMCVILWTALKLCYYKALYEIKRRKSL